MGETRLPLLESKLHVPRRRTVVTRDRLNERAAGSIPTVVLVSAPAGFGKTTLVVEWLAGGTHRAVRTAWLSLDQRDSDGSTFWTYVITALRRVAPQVGADALATLQATPAATHHVVASLLNDLAAVDGNIVLVLDDYHVVESIEVQESMWFMIEHLPSQLHVVITSRADPPWPLSSLRARGDLLEIRAADLRFTVDEAAAYLNDAMGLGLDSASVDVLAGRTEGWIAALQLAALSLRDRNDPEAFIAGFAGDDRFVVDYLIDEVLDRQTHDIRAFLLETSILSRLTGGLCAAVTGRHGAKATLETLERSNLFLVALDDRRQWYRYHHLFGDVLRARLTDEQPERVTQLHRLASDWFESNGDRPEAIRHALAAADHPRAADLIELAIPAHRQARQEPTLRVWIDALPAEILANRPVLTVGLVGARMGAGDTTGVAELLDSVEGWLDRNRPTVDLVVQDQVEFDRLPAQAAMYRAGLALLRGDLPDTITHGERAARLSTADDHLGRGAAAALIGLARWADGDLEAGARQYATAIAEFDAARYYADILGCSLGLADMQAGLGRLSAAERTLTAGLHLAATHGPLRGTPDMHIGLAEVHLERNELDAATDHLGAGLQLGERLALPQYTWRWRVVDARLRTARGDHAEALELLGEAARRYDTDYSPNARPVTATIARVQLSAGNVEAAAQWATESRLSPDDEPVYLREYEHLTLARVLIATGHARDAVTLLERLPAAAEAAGRAGNGIEARALLALAHDANGDMAHALDALDDALSRSQPERFAHAFLDLGPPMTRLLVTAIRHGRNTDRAAALLASPTTSVPTKQELVNELSARELDVLRLLRTELSGPEIASELVVSINTVRTHTKNIFMKLGVTNRRAAVRRADELGL